MARTARCPSCGAPVEFKSIVSVLAVCGYCQSTLLREGEDLANLGRMADLIEDRSPLQLGAEGRWRGRHFALIGRIQLRWEQGLWNEWHLLFDDGKSGWLSEAGGEYVITEPVWQPDALPPYSKLQVDQKLYIAGRSYGITNVLTAECVAGAGELPFKVGAGYALPFADLRDTEGGFATLDYSDDPARPLVFVGESVEFKRLDWNNLRAGMPTPEATVKARTFNCPSCAAPLKIEHENIQSVGCESCGAVLDTSSETAKLLTAGSRARKVGATLPLGARGRLRGEDVEIIGFMSRHMTEEGVHYRWNEYLLLGRENSLLWLSEYRGHWNLARVIPRMPAWANDKFVVDGADFKHFQSYDAFVDYVVGEFPWRVQIDEVAKVADYVAPPRMLSREITQSEQTFTLAEYLASEELQQAFKLPHRLPAAVGIFANQPNPHAETQGKVWGSFWKFLLLAFALHAALLLGARGPLLDESLEFTPNDYEPKVTHEFRLAKPVSRLEVEHEANINNNWISLILTLVNKDTGEIWQESREISHYEGMEGGERWTEGSRTSRVVFSALPKGTYVLADEADLAARSPPVRTRVKVSQPGPRWSSLFLLLGALALVPIYTFMRRRGFEVKRWAESDHPMIASSDDDSDSDD